MTSIIAVIDAVSETLTPSTTIAEAIAKLEGKVITGTDAAAAITAALGAEGDITSAIDDAITASVGEGGAVKTYVEDVLPQAAAQADSVATTAEGVVTDFNALLAKLRAAGLMAASE